MTSTHRLAQNTLYITLASIGQKVVALIYFTIIARFIGVEDTGAYFLSLAVIMMISSLVDVGITPVLIREVAKKHESAIEWCRNALGIKIIAIPICILITYFAPIALGYDAQLTYLIRIAAVILAADALSLTFYGALRARHNLKYESVGIFIGQFATAGVGIALVVSGMATLPLLIVALMVGSVWNVFYGALNVARIIGAKALIPAYTLGFKPLKMAAAFFLAAIFVKVYSYVDSLTLAQVIGNEAVGIYSVAYKMTYAFQFLPLAFVAALYPAMSSEANDPERLKKVLLQSLWYLALLAMPIVFGLWSLAPEIISAVYGKDYEASVLPFQILIFVLIPIFFDFPLGSLLNATNRQHIKTAIMGVTMIINIAANFILIPKIGVAGASLAGLISFIFLFIADWIFIRNVVKVTIVELIKQVGALTLAAGIMAIVVLLIKPYLHFAFVIPLGAIVYIGVAFATGAISLAHLRSMKRLLKKEPYEENIVTNA